MKVLGLLEDIQKHLNNAICALQDQDIKNARKSLQKIQRLLAGY